jgi:hypothetical protein
MEFVVRKVWASGERRGLELTMLARVTEEGINLIGPLRTTLEAQHLNHR